MINLAVSDYEIREKWNLKIEFVNDGACDPGVVTDHGARNYYGFSQNKRYGPEDCCNEATFGPKRSVSTENIFPPLWQN